MVGLTTADSECLADTKVKMGDFDCPICRQSFPSLKEVSIHCANCDPPQHRDSRQTRGGEPIGRNQEEVAKKVTRKTRKVGG